MKPTDFITLFKSDLGKVALISLKDTGSEPPVCVQKIESVEDHVNYYFTPNLVSPEYNRPKPPQKDHIVALTCFHADVDRIDENVLAFEPKPSVVVHSGGGYHMYWLFKSPVPATPEAVETVESVNSYIANALAGDPQSINVNRFLRLPGSVNWPTEKKKAKGRVPVKTYVLQADDVRYTIDDPRFGRSKAEKLESKGECLISEPAFEKLIENIDGDLPVALQLRLSEDMAFDFGLQSVWTGKSQQPDRTRSGFDFALAIALKRLNYTPEESALILLRAPHGSKKDMTWRGLNRNLSRSPQSETKAPDTKEFKLEDRKARLDFVLPRDIVGLDPQQYVVKGYVRRGVVTVIYGPPNCGKTFTALDMAYRIATGKTWGGNKTNQGPVMYIAGEAGVSAKNRVLAIKKHHGIQDFDLALIPHNIELLDNSEAAIQALKTLIDSVTEHFGQPPIMVVIDTLARSFVGGDENSSVDMAKYISKLDSICSYTNAAVLVVHHTGKDAGRGARGHSSLVAAVDAEIEVAYDPDKNTRQLINRKQRDDDKGVPIDIGLKSVFIGNDENGDPVTSCVVTYGDEPKEAKAIGALGEDEEAVLAMLKDMGKTNLPAAYEKWLAESIMSKNQTNSNRFKEILNTLKAHGAITTDLRFKTIEVAT